VASKRLRVVILGAGEVAQVIHLPTLHLLNHLYTVVAISDVSPKTVDFCATHYEFLIATVKSYNVINEPNVDVIFVLTSDEFHEAYTIAALKAGKHVMLENPLTLSAQSAQRIVDAEKTAPNGARVFVGYMRRYAPSFVNAFKREVASIDKVLYARCRGIVGPNAFFVNQSGASPVKYSSDLPAEASAERGRLLSTLFEEAFEGKEVTAESRNFCRFLGSLGSHDLSLMRETLGYPESVAGVSANEPFYSAILNYCNHDGSSFAVTYESGIDMVARFDSHLTIYGKNKTVSIQYDTPYIKGLPIKVKVDETNEHGEAVSKEILSSYEDAYTAELKEMHACFTQGKEIKTSAKDPVEDLRLSKMIFEQYERQQAQS